MSPDEYLGTMKGAIKIGVSKNAMGPMKNLLSKITNKGKRDMPSSSVLEGNPMTSSGHVIPPTRPAWEVPLIFRGDLIPKNKHLFCDVEKVNEVGSHRNVAATISVVDELRQLVFWAIIKRDNVCQVFPRLTGLSRDKIATGIPIDEVKNMLDILLVENTLVGVDIINDLKSLDYCWESKNIQIVDVHDFYKDEKGRINLQDIVTHLFPLKVNFQCSFHSAISDSRMTQKIWKKMMKLKSDGHDIHPEKIDQNKRGKIDVEDRCTCEVSKKKFKKAGKGRKKIQFSDFDFNSY